MEEILFLIILSVLVILLEPTQDYPNSIKKEKNGIK